jgi:spore maturation protein SpmB
MPNDALPRPRWNDGSLLGRALPRAGRTILMLMKLMLPISLGVGLLRWTGLLATIAGFFAPAMALFRLPGEAAVPLVTGNLAGIYALVGAMAMLPLPPTAVTTLAAMTLVAHNLIIEGAVQNRTGTPWWFAVGIRLLAMLVVGAIVAGSIALLQARDLPALWLRMPAPPAPPSIPSGGNLTEFLLDWGRGALKLALKIILIVTAMMIGTEWIRAQGIMEKLERASRPLLRFLGLSDRVAFPWLTAQIVGIAFGGGLLLEEMRRREIAPDEVRALHTSIGISHSLFEDTVLLVAVGASMFWIIVPRVLVAALMVRLVRPLSLGLRKRGVAIGS